MEQSVKAYDTVQQVAFHKAFLLPQSIVLPRGHQSYGDFHKESVGSIVIRVWQIMGRKKMPLPEVKLW